MNHRLGRWAAWVVLLVAGCRTEVIDFSSDTHGLAGAGGAVDSEHDSGGSSDGETGGRETAQAGLDEGVTGGRDGATGGATGKPPSEAGAGDRSTGGGLNEPDAARAGSAQDQTGGAATGGSDMGTGGRAAACDNVTPCGGDVVGTWTVTSSCLDVTGELNLTPYSLGCTSAPVRGSLRVTGTWTAHADGTYEDNTVVSGQERFTLAPQCLLISGVTTTCSVVSGGLQALGYSAVTCADAVSGGCDCTGTVDSATTGLAGGIGHVSSSLSSTGTYTTSGNVVTTSDDTRYSYCVSEHEMTIAPRSTEMGTLTGRVVLEDSGGAGGAGGAGGTSGAGGAGPDSSCKFVGPCTKADDDLAYGANSRVYLYDYNDAEQLISVGIDDNDDGVAEYVTRYSYDNQGNLLELKDDDCETATWGCRWIIYTYDDQGRALTVDDHSQYSGRVATCDTYVYGEGGNLARIESSPPGCGGRIDSIRAFEYDADGRKITESISYGVDEPASTLYHYSYDEAGQLTKEEVDAHADGSIDETIAYEYDGAGNLIRKAHDFVEGSLVDDYYGVWTYDEAGNQLTEKYVYPSETPSEQLCRTRTYDECSNLLTDEYATTCSEPAVSRSTYSYDCFD